MAEVRAERGTRRVALVTVIVGGLILVLVIVGISILNAWRDELKKAYQAVPPHNPSSWAVVGGGLEGAAGLVIVAVIIGIVIWWGVLLLWPAARTGNPEVIGLLALASAGVPTGLLGLLLVFSSGDAASKVAWQLAHHRPATNANGYAWAPLVDVGTAVVLLAAGLPLGWALLVWLPVLLEQTFPAGGSAAVAAKLATWRSALNEALLSLLRGEISSRVARMHLLEDSKGLRQVRGAPVLVLTPAGRQLATMAAAMDNGSIALSGPRGAGKSALLNAFCSTDPGSFGLVLSVPVVFDRREFMLHLFDSACRLAIKENLHARDEARARLEWIRYLQTRSDEVNASAGWKGLTLR